MVITYKKFSKLLNMKQKIHLAALFFMMLAGSCLEVLGVSMMVPLVSVIMQPDIMEEYHFIRGVCEWLQIDSYQSFLLLCIGSLVIIFILKDIFLIFQYNQQYKFVFINRFEMQKELLNIYMERPYETYLKLSSGEIIRVVQTDVRATYDLLSNVLTCCTESIVSLALIITILVIDPVMIAFVAVMILFTMFLLTRFINPVLKREGQLRQESLAVANKWLLQAVSGMKEVKVTNKKDFFVANFQAAGGKTIKAEKWQVILGNIPRLMIEMVSICSMLLFLFVTIVLGREVSTLIPSISAFAMAAVKLMPSANRIMVAINNMAFYGPSLDKLLENLKELENNKSENKESDLKSAKKEQFALMNAVELNNITYQYPDAEFPVLEKADMKIPIGKSVGIVGASGAGKTTVVDIMLGLLEPREGEVLADGMNIKCAYQGWLSHIGYIPQMIFMLDDTIRANVSFGIPGEETDEEQVWRALEEAQLKSFVESLPEGLDTVIGERGVRLSGGQRQRIGIARALYPDPDLLLFDEATSALDNETEAAVMESINSLHGKKTMVIIAHRLGTIADCDMVYRVENGKIKLERMA